MFGVSLDNLNVAFQNIMARPCVPPMNLAREFIGKTLSLLLPMRNLQNWTLTKGSIGIVLILPVPMMTLQDHVQISGEIGLCTISSIQIQARTPVRRFKNWHIHS